jgi:hypothetical protein
MQDPSLRHLTLIDRSQLRPNKTVELEAERYIRPSRKMYIRVRIPLQVWPFAFSSLPILQVSSEASHSVYYPIRVIYQSSTCIMAPTETTAKPKQLESSKVDDKPETAQNQSTDSSTTGCHLQQTVSGSATEDILQGTAKPSSMKQSATGSR